MEVNNRLHTKRYATQFAITPVLPSRFFKQIEVNQNE
jgi:hypothetical protein